MSLGDRAGAWWAAWKVVVLLALLLFGSVWLNVFQWKRAITAPLRGENRALTQALDRVSAIAEQRHEDDTQLLADLEQIAERGRTERVVYAKAAAQKPLETVCAPGQDRVDAVNQTLGPVGPLSGEK